MSKLEVMVKKLEGIGGRIFLNDGTSVWLYKLAEVECRRNTLDVKKMRDQCIEQLIYMDIEGW